MMFLKIAIGNLRKNRKRNLNTGIAIAISVIVMILMTGFMLGMKDLILNSITGMSGHILIQNSEKAKATEPYSLDYSISNLNSLISRLKNEKEVKAIYPLIEFSVMAYADTASLFMGDIGITQEDQGYLPTLIRKSLKQGSFLDSGSVLISRSTANVLGLKVGDKLSIFYTREDFPYAADRVVGGIFETGNKEIDENLIIMRFDDVQKMLGMENMATSVKVMIEDFWHPDNVIDRLKGFLQTNGLLAKSWQKMYAGFLGFIKVSEIILYVINAFIVIVASFCIINTVFMSVSERTREIGTMRAIGMRRKDVIKMILTESVILGILGALAGLIIGGIINYLGSSVGINFGDVMQMFPGSQKIFKTSFSIPSMLFNMLLGVIISILSALYPAYRAAYEKPSRALRYV